MPRDQLNYPADLPDKMDQMLRVGKANYDDSQELRRCFKQLSGTSEGQSFVGMDQVIDHHDRDYTATREDDERLAREARLAHERMMALDNHYYNQYTQLL